MALRAAKPARVDAGGGKGEERGKKTTTSTSTADAQGPGGSTRPTQTAPGGIVEKEAGIHMSNVSHIDPKDDKPTRVGFKMIEGDRKVRFAKRSGEIIDR